MVNGMESSHLAFYGLLGGSAAASAAALGGVVRHLRLAVWGVLLYPNGSTVFVVVVVVVVVVAVVVSSLFRRCRRRRRTVLTFTHRHILLRPHQTYRYRVLTNGLQFNTDSALPREQAQTRCVRFSLTITV